MFGIGAGELIMLLALALIIVGPQKLPEIARTVGKTVAQFKAYTDDMRSVLTLDPTATATPAAQNALSKIGLPFDGASAASLFDKITATPPAQTTSNSPTVPTVPSPPTSIYEPAKVSSSSGPITGKLYADSGTAGDSSNSTAA